MVQSFYASASALALPRDTSENASRQEPSQASIHDRGQVPDLSSMNLSMPAPDVSASRRLGTHASELEMFIASNRREMDTEALSVLLGLSPEEQRRVMDAGSLFDCRDSSAALIRSRLRLRMPASHLETFTHANQQWLSEESKLLLRSLTVNELDSVIDGGDLANCRDTVAVIRSRLRSGSSRARPAADTANVGSVSTKDPWSAFSAEARHDTSASARAPAESVASERSRPLSMGPGERRGGNDEDFAGPRGRPRPLSVGPAARTRSSELDSNMKRGAGDIDGAKGADVWATFRAKAEERAGVPLPAPMGLKGRAGSPPPRPQLRTGHVPVLLSQTLDALFAPGHSGIYVDGTFGRGGHSTEILKRLPPGSRLVAFDVDPSAIAVGRELEQMDPRFTIVHRPFADIGEVLHGERLAGAMIDIGFSSPQVDEQHRGFSVVEDGPLDLRMNPRCGRPFSDWLLHATPEEIAWIVREWGEDDDPIMAMRIAEAVSDKQRQCGEYRSTLDLAESIRQVKMGQDDRGQHPGKLAFQSFRVFINNEMAQLDAWMQNTLPLLQKGARAVVITFKRPEAAFVKRFLREHEEPHPSLEQAGVERLLDLYPLLRTAKPFAVRQPCPPMTATAAEIAMNRRSRSSMVHILECCDRSSRWWNLGANSASRSLHECFRRPLAAWTQSGQRPCQARVPPRTSGSVASTLLAGADQQSKQ